MSNSLMLNVKRDYAKNQLYFVKAPKKTLSQSICLIWLGIKDFLLVMKLKPPLHCIENKNMKTYNDNKNKNSCYCLYDNICIERLKAAL